MGVRQALGRAAASCAHVFVAEVPGSWPARAAVERAVLGRGWRLAASPADADVLVVCGEPGPQLAGAVEQVWHQLPGPRVRVTVRGYDDVAGRLEEAHAALLHDADQREDAVGRPAASDLLAQHSEVDAHQGETGHGDMDHEGMDHEDMDHGDMDMAPGGIPLAEGSEDRDGLEMDVLTVRLGPLLPQWPPGLVLHAALHGDVVAEARAELTDGPPVAVPGGSRAQSLDNLTSLLTLAGWDDAAAQARRLRDDVLAHEVGQSSAQSAQSSARSSARSSALASSMRRRLRRSVLLRWSLRGVRPVSADRVAAQGLPPDIAGDAYDRLLRLVDRATGEAARDRRGRQDAAADRGGPRSFTGEQLAGLVTGLDLATARLVIAGLDVHGLGAASTGEQHREVAHG